VEILETEAARLLRTVADAQDAMRDLRFTLAERYPNLTLRSSDTCLVGGYDKQVSISVSQWAERADGRLIGWDVTLFASASGAIATLDDRWRVSASVEIDYGDGVNAEHPVSWAEDTSEFDTALATFREFGRRIVGVTEPVEEFLNAI
jgi:hypothetical protein